MCLPLKPIFINLLAAKGAKFAKYSGGKNPVFGENGYFQVINSGTVDVVIAERPAQYGVIYYTKDNVNT